MIRKAAILLSGVALLGACSGSAPTPVESFGGWQVMTAHSGDSLCYAGAVPFKSRGSIGTSDRKAFLMATRRPSGKIEVSASPGYSFKTGSRAEIAVDGDSYPLFFKDAVGWALNDADDKEMVEGMKEADEIQVRGISKSGLTSVDSYSAEGFAPAVKRIRELCP